MDAADAVARVEQASKNAAWWLGELAAGRITYDRKAFDFLFRDLEIAGALPGLEGRAVASRA